MVWKRVQKSPSQKCAAQVRFRPNLDSLEDRLVLSPTTFYVDDTQSFLTLSGNISGIQVQEQAPGSLTTAYTGAFVADVDFDNGAITFFNGGNDVGAENSGNWRPDENNNDVPAPANYGGMISFLGTGHAAVRNLNVGASSDALALTSLGDGVSYTFPNDETLTINSGTANLFHPLAHGSADLSNNSTANQADSQGNASYLFDINGDGGSFLVLYVAIDVQLTGTFSGFNYTLNIDGAIVAVGSIGTGPAAHGGHHGSDASLGTSLTLGAQSTGDTLLSDPVANLDGSGSLAVRQASLTEVQSQSQTGVLGTANSQVPQQTAADHLDAVFVEMSPIENLKI